MFPCDFIRTYVGLRGKGSDTSWQQEVMRGFHGRATQAKSQLAAEFYLPKSPEELTSRPKHKAQRKNEAYTLYNQADQVNKK